MFFNLMLRGFIIGISFTIPGCSGGTFAVYVGIYDQLLHAIGNIFKEFKKSMTFLIPVGLGLVTGIILFSKLMALALEANSFITIMVFIGLTIGGIPNLFKNVKGKKITASGLIAFLVAFAIVIVMLVFQIQSGANDRAVLAMDFPTVLVLFGLGFIAAITMIIPGVSGSAFLMILGYYTAIVSNVVGNLLDFSHFGYNLFVLIPFALGAVTGVIAISKILETVLRKVPVQSFLAIIGFIVASAAILLFWIRDPQSADLFVDQTPIYLDLGHFLSTHIWTVVTGILALGAGLVLSLQIVKLGYKPKNAER
jgi:putative membrane protein